MTIPLTQQQWADVQHTEEAPPRMSDPAEQFKFVLVPEVTYDRVRALFENLPFTVQERLSQLQEFGKRAGWDDPQLDVYNDLDPRRA